jgi:6-phosphogluconolactonase
MPYCCRLLIALGLAIWAWPLRAESPAGPAACWAYVGTFTGAKSQGIYLLKVDAATGAMASQAVAATASNPSFLTINPQTRILYAICDDGQRRPERTGQVAAYAMGQTGGLTELARASSGGSMECYVSLTPDGHTALVANYGDGRVSALPLDSDGKFKPDAAVVVQHHGSSVDPRRQQGPHAHCFDADPAGRFALAADLGLDKILVYRLDAPAAVLTPNDPPSFSLPPGSGPRHLAFDPHGRFVYIVSEMASTVTACRYDAARGTLAALQTISTLPADFHGSNTGAEIHIHPSGKFLYASNRGHDSIACFSIDAPSGMLTSIGFTATQGKTPRGFGLDPSGTLLLAANQESDSIVVFRIDPHHGTLESTGQQVTIPNPVCVTLTPVTQ